jgi:hypothetical protein
MDEFSWIDLEGVMHFPKVLLYLAQGIGYIVQVV